MSKPYKSAIRFSIRINSGRVGSGQAWDRPSTHYSLSDGMTLYFNDGGPGGISTKLSPCAVITN